MTFQDLGSLGEFIGGILVVVSLFYLASQIRQNTRSLRAAAYQDAVRAANAWSTFLVNDSRLGPLFQRGIADFRSLDESDRSQFDELLSIVIRDYATVLVLEREGLLTGISVAYEAGLRWIFSSPSLADWWAENKQYFAPDCHERMSELLAA